MSSELFVLEQSLDAGLQPKLHAWVTQGAAHKIYLCNTLNLLAFDLASKSLFCWRDWPA